MALLAGGRRPVFFTVQCRGYFDAAAFSETRWLTMPQRHEHPVLRVATYNIHKGVQGLGPARRLEIHNLGHAVEQLDADIVCLQEVRATTDQLHEVLATAGLSDLHVAHDSSARLGHAGVAILSTKKLSKIKTGVGPKEFADTGRWVQAEIDTKKGPMTVASVYVHSGDAEKPVQQEKYRFLEAMTKKFQAAQKADELFLACGDFNVGHCELDIKNWKGNLTKAGFLPEERADSST